MKKRQRVTKQEESLTPDEPGLDISSLIDVCFLLLIYFLVTTTIQPREQDLKVAVPQPGDSPDFSLLSPMVIELRQGGEVVVNPGDAAEVFDADSGSHELPRLRERLDSMGNLGQVNIPRVLLRVDNRVRQQRYIDVLNCLAGAGISDIALED